MVPGSGNFLEVFEYVSDGLDDGTLLDEERVQLGFLLLIRFVGPTGLIDNIADVPKRFDVALQHLPFFTAWSKKCSLEHLYVVIMLTEEDSLL